MSLKVRCSAGLRVRQGEGRAIGEMRSSRILNGRRVGYSHSNAHEVQVKSMKSLHREAFRNTPRASRDKEWLYLRR